MIRGSTCNVFSSMHMADHIHKITPQIVKSRTHWFEAASSAYYKSMCAFILYSGTGGTMCTLWSFLLFIFLHHKV